MKRLLALIDHLANRWLEWRTDQAIVNDPELRRIAQEVERLAPSAYLINFTNPLARVCLALTRYTRVQVVGMCHQINKGYYCTGHILGLAPRIPEEASELAIASEMQKQRLKAVATSTLTRQAYWKRFPVSGY